MNFNSQYYSKDQNIKFRMTTPEEERELWVKAKSGDEEARTFLIHNHLLFASMQAQRLNSGQLPKNEVISAANFAVMKAYETFDYTRGFRFTTYLRPFIRGEISALWKSKFAGGIADPSFGGPSAFRADDRVSNHKDCSVQFKERGMTHNPEPEEDHPAEELDLKRFNGKAVVAAVSKLTKSEQALIRQVYVQEKSLADIGRERGVSRAAVQATHARIIKKLKRLLGKGVSL